MSPVNRLRAELRWSGQAAWRGLVELVNSNDLTHAAAIAYYALLSLFPFLLLIISLLGSVTASENQRLAVLTFVFRYFPTRLDFVAARTKTRPPHQMRHQSDVFLVCHPGVSFFPSEVLLFDQQSRRRGR